MKLKEINTFNRRISGVYLIVSIKDGYKYVGSSGDVCRRAKMHLSSLRHNKHHNKLLQESFKKYGEENFIWKLLEEFSGTDYELKKLEKKWYDIILQNGNNMTNIADPLNGTAGMKFKRSDEFCKRMSIVGKQRVKKYGLPKGFGGEIKTFLGKHHTIETKQKMSEQKQGKLNPMYGVSPSLETRQKISLSHKGKKFNEEHNKKVSESKKGKPNGHEGMKYSEEWRKNISQSLKGKTTFAKSTIWINDGKKSKRILASEKIPEGFVPGRCKNDHDKMKSGRENFLNDKSEYEKWKEKIKVARAKQIMPKWTEERRIKFDQTLKNKEKINNEYK